MRLLFLVLVSLIGCLGCRGQGVTTEQPTHMVMSFNIRYGTARDGENAWDRRRDLLFRVVREADPDILGLQEALKFQADEIMAAIPGYQGVFVGRDDGGTRGEACALLYQHDRYDLTRTGTFWLSDTPDVPGSNTWGASCVRICTWGHFTDRATGARMHVYNTHLDNVSTLARRKGIRLILERIASRGDKDPVILMGDFNEGEGGEVVRVARSQLVDAFRKVHPDTQHHGVGTFNAFKNTTDGEKIDFVFVTPGVEVLAADIIRTHENGHNASDHFPVTARIRLP